MSDPTPSPIGEQMYFLLPEIYRTKDQEIGGDLCNYFQSAGRLLDAIKSLLLQRLADCAPLGPTGQPNSLSRLSPYFPQPWDPNLVSAGEPTCQPWLLPYFAQLLDVKLVSPKAAGQALEVGQGVSWRKRKGTLACVEEIAEAVGGFEVEICEGWRRVLVTPRVGFELQPVSIYGLTPKVNEDDHLSCLRHPDFPAGTVDLRHSSCAIGVLKEHPGAKERRLNEEVFYWNLTDYHGVPCFPGSYQDFTRRTVDLRTPNWKQGHYHPKRLLLFTSVPDGFFPKNRKVIPWSAVGGNPMIDIQTTVESVTYRNIAQEPVFIKDSLIISFTPAGPKVISMESLAFDHSITVDNGRLKLRNVAVKSVIINTSELEEPVLEAVNCLFETIKAPDGLVRLEYCTVLQEFSAANLQASDCIFAGELKFPDPTNPLGNDIKPAGCIRYSAIPETGAFPKYLKEIKTTNTTAKPIFFNHKFGQAGCGVLHPAAPRQIWFGAEDGGEMGAYHEVAYCLRFQAVLDKLQDFLPLGITPVIVPDEQLNQKPPQKELGS